MTDILTAPRLCWLLLYKQRMCFVCLCVCVRVTSCLYLIYISWNNWKITEMVHHNISCHIINFSNKTFLCGLIATLTNELPTLLLRMYIKSMNSSTCYISETDKWIPVKYATPVYTASCQVRNVVQISEKLTVWITGTDLTTSTISK